MGMTLTERELATVLTALRYWQQALTRSQQGGPVAEHFDEVNTPLTILEIDDLCERLNCDLSQPRTGTVDPADMGSEPHKQP